MPSYTVNVGASVSGTNFHTIQAALEAADPGSTIMVHPGSYTENLTITKSVSLLSLDGRDATTIVGTSNGALGTIVIAPNVNDVTIGDVDQGFKVVGIDNPSAGIESAAIYLQGAHSDIVLRGNEIEANGDGAILTEYGSAVSHMTIDQNTISGETFDSSQPIPDFTTFSADQFTFDNIPRVAVYFGNTNKTNISFTNNTVTAVSGGVDASGDFRGNLLVSLDGENNTASGNTFEGVNRGENDLDFANALRMRGAGMTITNNVFDVTQSGGLQTTITPISVSGNEFNGEGVVFGSQFNDIINGSDLDDQIFADGGNDIIDGFGGTDTLDMTAAGAGGAFVDLASGLAFSTLTGMDTLSSIENIRGSAGNDGLYGAAGDNTFFATAGTDIIDGRGDVDTYDMSAATSGVTINLTTGTASGGGFGTATLTSIENAIGGSGGDVFVGSAGVNVMTGNGGEDQFSGFTDGDVVHGGEGTDRATFSGNFADAVVTAGTESGTFTVTVGGVTVTLDGVETLQFDDGSVRIVSADGASGYDTIQSAVDASAASDIVYVLDGTYAEQVVVSGKTISIVGESEDGVVVKAPAGTIDGTNHGDGYVRSSIITITGDATVTVSTLTVDGEGRGHQIESAVNLDFHGIAYINAGGSVEDVSVKGIRAPLDGNGQVSGGQQGRAIYANNLDSAARNLTVKDSTVTDFQKNGIDLRGSGLTVTVEDNHVTGNGATPTIAQNGIALVSGVEGTVSGNTVAEVGYVMTGSNAGATSAGILSFSSDVTISGNTVTVPTEPVVGPDVLSASGIYSYNDADGSTITGNTVSGFPTAIGSEADGGSPTVTGNILTDNDINLETFDATAPVTITGTDGHDELGGGAFNDTLNGGGGDDTLDGAGGIDTADYSDGALASDAIVWNATEGVFEVTTASGGTDTLTSVEVAEFSDATVWLVASSADLTQALANASANDIIKLADGEYTGNFTVSTDGLTIESANGDAAEVVIKGTFKSLNSIADNVTVGDFVKTNAYNGTPPGLSIAADGVTISNITISEYLTGIDLQSSDGLTLNGIVLDENVFGVYKLTPGAEVTDFTMNGGVVSNGYIGVYSTSNRVGLDMIGSFSGIVIDGTTFEHITQKGMYFEQLDDAELINLVMNDVGQYGGGVPFGANGLNGAGIDINLKYGDFANVTISDFEFTNVGTSNGLGSPHVNGGAIAIKARDDGGDYGTAPATLDGVTVKDGTIDGTSTGIRFGEPGKTTAGPANVTVTNVGITGAIVGSYDNQTTSVREITLSEQADTVTTNPASTGILSYFGLGGDDHISGSAAVEYMDGGAGNDTLTSGGGADILTGGEADDNYFVSGGAETIVELADGGTDTVTSSAAAFTLAENVERLFLSGTAHINGTGNSGANQITGNSGNNVLSGMGGNDTILGGVGTDTLNGGEGDDVLEGGADADVIDGGNGSDTASYANSNVAVNVNLTGAVSGGHANGDTLISIENLIGSIHSDILVGDGNANTIEGGAGADFLFGGAGNDTVSYASSNAAVTINLATSAASGGHATGDFITEFENILGSAHADLLTGNSAANLIKGGLGSDVLNGASGNDTLEGGDDADSLNGGSGKDVIDGGLGADIMTGGSDSDKYFVDNISDVIIEVSGQGTDRILTSTSYVLAGGVSIELFTTTSHAGIAAINLTGNEIGQNIWGNAAANIIDGGAGDDVLIGGAGADSLNGGADRDAASYAENSPAGVGADLQVAKNNTGVAAGDTFSSIEDLIGSQYKDILRGDQNGNAIFGGVGDDLLYGRNGDDTLNGGVGKDVLNGGLGSDKFVFDQPLVSGNVDLIREFTPIDNDEVHLDNAVFIGLQLGALDVDAFVANATGLASDASDRVIYQTTTGDLYFDQDGDGSAHGSVLFARLENLATLTSADFVVI